MVNLEGKITSRNAKLDGRMDKTKVENNYEKLKNKPLIESVELTGNKDFEDLGLVEVTNQQILDLFK